MNIYLPEDQLNDDADGFLLGYRFENSQFVVSSVISSTQIESIEDLSNILRHTTKLQAFNRYCAGELTLLGVLDNANNAKNPLSKRADVQ